MPVAATVKVAVWPAWAVAAWGWVVIVGATAALTTVRLAGLLVALPALFGGLAAIILSALLVGGTFVVTTLASLQVARETARGDATRLVAAMTAAFALGQIIGPLAAGGLFDAGYGFDAVLILGAVLLALTALLLSEPRARKAA